MGERERERDRDRERERERFREPPPPEVREREKPTTERFRIVPPHWKNDEIDLVYLPLAVQVKLRILDRFKLITLRNMQVNVFNALLENEERLSCEALHRLQTAAGVNTWA